MDGMRPNFHGAVQTALARGRVTAPRDGFVSILTRPQVFAVSAPESYCARIARSHAGAARLPQPPRPYGLTAS